MTSRNLFFKLMKQDIKKRIWCPILVFVAYFLVMEVRLLMETEKYLKASSRYFYDDGFYDIVTYVRAFFFGRDAAKMSIIACVAAFVCGISGFAYLHSKIQLDTYHSLPVSRSQLFWSKYVSGILQFFFPFVIHVLICVGIAAGRNAFIAETIPSVISYVIVNLVVFVLTYSVSIVAVGLTGNIIISILGTFILYSYSTVIGVLTFILSERFFGTYITYSNHHICSWVSDKIWCFSPLSMILRLFVRQNSMTLEEAKKFYTYNTTYIWVLAAAAVVYSLAAYVICQKRASEAAGKSIVFPAAEPVIKTMIVIPVSFFIAVFFNVISPNTTSDRWFLFGLIFGFMVFCILIEIIFRLDIHSAFMHKKQFLFNAACTALLFVIFRYDVTGYDTYVPADSQIQSCAVSIQQLMPLQQNIQVNEFGNHYLSAEEYRMAHMGIQGNQSVMELAHKAAKEQLSYHYFDYYEGIEKDPVYIETLDRQENYRSIVFGYKLKNGKTVYRQYMIDIADEQTLKLLSDIFYDSQYKLGSNPVFNKNWNVSFTTVKCESNFKRQDIMLTQDMQTKLIETYQKEYMNLTLDTVMHVIPVGVIEFWINSEYGGRPHEMSYTGGMYVYSQFAETIALLNQYGFDMEEKLTADDVETISVQRKQYDESTDTPTDQTIKYTDSKDKEAIQQILDCIVNHKFSWQIDRFADYFDEQYDITVKFNDKSDTHMSYSFIKGQVPDFVKISEKNN